MHLLVIRYTVESGYNELHEATKSVRLICDLVRTMNFYVRK
jgi:hypothetical protein